MANWTASGGTSSGSLSRSATVEQYAPAVSIPNPSTVSELVGSPCTGYAAGSNGNGGDAYLYKVNSTTSLILVNDGVTEFNIDMQSGAAGGNVYPTSVINCFGRNADVALEPRSAFIHDGLLVIAGKVADWGGGTDNPTTRADAANWDLQNRHGFLGYNIGSGSNLEGAGINLIAAGTNQVIETGQSPVLGNQWMLSRPTIIDDNTIAFFCVNYCTVASSGYDAPFKMQVLASTATKSDGTWTIGNTVVIYERPHGSTLGERTTHIHCAHGDWDGTRLTVNVVFGDTTSYNYTWQISHTPAGGTFNLAQGNTGIPSGWNVVRGGIYEHVALVDGLSNNLAFDSSAQTIVRTSGSWVTDGAVVGDRVNIRGSENPDANNIGENDALSLEITAIGGTGDNTLTLAASSIQATNATDSLAIVEVVRGQIPAGSNNWAEQGFVNGDNNWNQPRIKAGHQTTWFLKMGDGLTYVGADETMPAIASADLSSATAGADIEYSAAYLGHPITFKPQPDAYTSLIADKNEDGTRAVAVVVAGGGYSINGTDDNVSHLAVYQSGYWRPSGIFAEAEITGAACFPNGDALIGGSTLRRVSPGAAEAYTPAVSSVGGTNLWVTDAPGEYSIVAGQVTTDAEASFGEFGLGIPTGFDPAHTFLSKAIPVYTSAPGALPFRLSEKDGERATLTASTTGKIQIRVGMKSLNTGGLRINWTPRSSANADPTPNTEFTGGVLMDTIFNYSANDWAEISVADSITAAPVTDYGCGLMPGIQGAVNEPATITSYADFHHAFAYGHLIFGATDYVHLDIPLDDGAGANVLSDTEIAWTLPSAAFPMTIKGATHHRGFTTVELDPLGDQDIAGDRFLFRMEQDATNFLDFYYDVTAERVEARLTLSSTPQAVISLGTIEVVKSTKFYINLTESGDDLTCTTAYQGGTATEYTITNANTLTYTTLTQDDGTNQGSLMMASVSSGSGGNSGATAGKLISMGII